ncbi:putative small lipoprotein YifL [Halomonas campaniensis]|uniref:Putative small lipoprotein YifL n=1 Tax=Halomonas campaniensis TaxID=213554 RepID=A0A7W5K2K6_9GAMM|nr:lipoprotein [Halomonas campaniensis]MBB3330795.1 putative small lipoprotein YifL [Halomonas campaniensis]
MQRIAFAILALALLLGLAGCGQKGPLYLPGDEQAAEQYGPRDAGDAAPAPAPAPAPDDSET